MVTIVHRALYCRRSSFSMDAAPGAEDHTSNSFAALPGADEFSLKEAA